MKKMLLSFAHPDDETFTCGLTVPKYVRSGWEVQLFCATLGEAGATGPYELASGDALGAVRKQELARAAEILGISRVLHLGYRDAKLSGTEPGELEDVLYRKMLEYAPDVVITFDSTGITNNPDHIRISYATTFAFQKYAEEISEAREFVERVNRKDPYVKKRHFAMKHKVALKSESFTEAVDRAGVPRLYHAVVPESFVSFQTKSGKFPPEMFGKPFIGTPDKKITTIIDGTREFGKKLRALEAHVSQGDDVRKFVEAVSGSRRQYEYFILRLSGTQEVFMSGDDRISDRL